MYYIAMVMKFKNKACVGNILVWHLFLCWFCHGDLAALMLSEMQHYLHILSL